MIDVSPISQRIWDMKYRLRDGDGQPVDKTISETWLRVAKALAVNEKSPEIWEQNFFEALADFRFLPAGRILSGAGSGRNVTLFNCFVMGEVPDNMAGIFEGLKEAALTMQQGGGIGYDFSTLRPKGALVKGVGADSSGPLSFMDVWDAMCRTIMSAGSRRGAMMAVMNCSHPDIEAFIKAKEEPGRLRMFNLSVLITDDFMRAVKEDADWELCFDGAVYKRLKARGLWGKIMRAAYAYAEPGVIFIDRINRLNPLNYCETIHATNPCGEQPLPPYGACLLGSINLARLVERPFAEKASLDESALKNLTAVAVRMLDNAIGISRFPLPSQEHEATAKRRIGLGVTGLADALIMCRARYGGNESIRLASSWMKAIQNAAYLASAALAAEKGAFPLYDPEKYLSSEIIRGLDEQTRSAIAANGVRNALLTSVAPTGTISLFAGNVSSGLEPVFSFQYFRQIMAKDGVPREEKVSDYAFRMFRRMFGESTPLPSYFIDAQGLSPGDHLAMQAAIQKHVDSSISKTINVPEAIAFEDFKDIYVEAYDLGCKGCSTYRPNDVTGAVLNIKKSASGGGDDQPELPLAPPKSSLKAALGKPQDVGETSSIVHLTRPLDRPEALPGATYKIRWPESDHAIYITLNDIVQDRRRRPFEVFINDKNMEHYAWMVALTRMISAVFRRGGDVSFVVEELKAVFDPRGGHWMGGKYVPSLLAAIGNVIEGHMINIGFLRPQDAADENGLEQKSRMAASGAAINEAPGIGPASGAAAGTVNGRFRKCPKCSMPGLVRQEGCDTCASCGYSKCS